MEEKKPQLVPARIWSKKIIAVLRHFRLNPDTVLFGITGDIDNLGIFVAKNGRAEAEVLVDSYNRIVGLMYYEFIRAHSDNFFETYLLPAGEEVFIIGTSSDENIVNHLFRYIEKIDIPKIIRKSGLTNVSATNISFGCSLLTKEVDASALSELLSAIDSGDVLVANQLYVEIIRRLRETLAIQLDKKKFKDISEEVELVELLRKIVYTKTLEYKDTTKDILKRMGTKIDSDDETKDTLSKTFGRGHGLGGSSYQDILEKLHGLIE